MSPPSLRTAFCLGSGGQFLYLIGKSRNSARAALDFPAECRYKRPTAAITSSSTGQLVPLPPSLCPLAFQHTEWSEREGERERRPNLPASVSDALLSLPLSLSLSLSLSPSLSIRPSAPDAVAAAASDLTNAASDAAAAESDLCSVSVRAAGEWRMAGRDDRLCSLGRRSGGRATNMEHAWISGGCRV